ncbi:CpaD family pilus assembly protein [Candidatus Liberibacter americanus]|nr:CpaD family pilus assembly protein [Candidatus Liberibacter americanus]
MFYKKLIIIVLNFFSRIISCNIFCLRMIILIQLAFSMSSCFLNTKSSINNDVFHHPFMMKRTERSLDLKFLSGRWKITDQMRSTIEAFVDSYKKNSSTVIFIMLPSPTVSSAAIKSAANDIRSIFISNGIPANSISERLYDANYGLDIDTIRLSYFAARPYIGRQCGLWPNSIIKDNSLNGNWYNYGCAFHHNLLAQIDNPLDLIHPRLETLVDGEMTDKAIDSYYNKGLKK